MITVINILITSNCKASEVQIDADLKLSKALFCPYQENEASGPEKGS